MDWKTTETVNRGAVKRRVGGGFPALAAVLSVVLSVVSLGHLPATAQDVQATVAPESVGLSPAGLEAVTRFLEREVDAGRIAGAVGLIARHGRVAYLQGVGYADIAAKTRMQADTLFRIASMTKAITSVAVLMLVDEGKLRLSDPLSRVLPEFRNLTVLSPNPSGEALATVPAERAVTIDDLLTHTSGITYGWSGPDALDKLYREAGVSDTFLPIGETLEDRMARLARLPLKFQPGNAWEYGFSLDVLGRVVEVVSGLTLQQYFHERIFRPLGMRDTWFYVPGAQRARLASLYTTGEDGALRRVGSEPVTAGFLRFSGDYCHAGKGRFFSGGGGLVSTAGDYRRFLQMLLDGGARGDVRILKRETVAEMTRNQIGELVVPSWGHGDSFGYGFGVLTQRGVAEDVARIGTYSWGGIFNTYYWVDPQEELIGVLMTQIFPFAHLKTRTEFKRLAYAALDDSGFVHLHWYEKGAAQANPFFNQRQLRVNAPETSIHPTFSQRSEARSSGLARILIGEDLLKIRRAALYCEIWGGHPGTARKRVAVNGRSLYSIPEVGTAGGHCTHQYPEINLKVTDLVRGYNALQFACDKGATFWGHYIVDNACLKLWLPAGHPSLARDGLTEFAPRVEASPVPGGDAIRLWITGTAHDLAKISEVHFQGRYAGFDENGDTWPSGWHGMTKARRPYGMIGTGAAGATGTAGADKSIPLEREDGRPVERGKRPFEVIWDTRLLAAQRRVAVRAHVYLRGREGLVYTTPVTGGLDIPKRAAAAVSWHLARDLPERFWSRAGQKKTCVIELDLNPANITAAELHVVAWTGGAGNVTEYFTLNGRHFPVAEGSGHEVVYSRLVVDPSLLQKGENRIELLSDTEHHGIEILRPGPALVVRARAEDGE